MSNPERKPRTLPAASTAGPNQPNSSDNSRAQLLQTAAVATVLLAIALVSYGPALPGALLWDDDAHVTRPDLRSTAGLYRIWFDLGATQQYYPLLHSAFWLEHRMWGDNTFGYHLANVLLHAIVATLAYVTLRKLHVPGAFFAALLFTVHPVHVESVAWITEQKNTLSAVFYLSALLSYLTFDEGRKTRWYLAALSMFVLGLATKTVTATLPAALLVIFWWQRGKLTWRRDGLPLIPLFVLGAAAGLFTAWVERQLIGAEGADFQMTVVERLLLAGRVPWFYLWKLVWPANLMLFYPRWVIDPNVWWQWLFPLATGLTIVTLWSVRGKWRGPLAVALLFLGTIFPVLGFLNVYPFLFSFVADHFQYLASLSVLAAAAAGGAIVAAKATRNFRRGLHAAGVMIAGILAVLTWQQTHEYMDAATLYRAAVERNPGAFLAWHNLGVMRNEAGQPRDAIELFDRTARLQPTYPNTYLNKGIALVALGQMPEAITCFRQALAYRPNFVEAHNNLASALHLTGDPRGAVEHYNQAVRLWPEHAQIRMSLAGSLLQTGNIAEALAQLERAVELDPSNVAARRDLAQLLLETGAAAQAAEQAQQGVRLQPKDIQARNILGAALGQQGRFAEAAAEFQEIVRMQPEVAQAKCNLMYALAGLNRRSDAIQTGENALAQARENGETALAERIAAWLDDYRNQSSTESAKPSTRSESR